MLWTVFLILMVIWALGLATLYTLGGFIHLPLLFALVTLAIDVLQGGVGSNVRCDLLMQHAVEPTPRIHR